MSTAEAPGTSGLMIPVRWAGADEFGGAGLRGYNVEMREGSGAWSRWLTETTQTKADFPGEDGKQYSFRVQGVDRVGNAGAWLETAAVTTNAVTKYYALGGQRVAMRQGSAVYYLYGDHLGSTSLVTDATGTTLTETRYEPYGQPYWQWGATRTDFGFTGQRLDGFGLMDYNARYYSSTLGRFVSPDSIIPRPGSPLAWDRYGYVYSNPARNVDPSGHKACEWDENGNCVRDPDWEPSANTASMVATTESENNQRNNVPPGWEINGWQLQLTGIAGFPTNIPRMNGETVSFLLFYGVSIVFDFDGGIQIFGLKRDIDFDPELIQGPAENKYKTDVLGLGLTIATGPLFGQGMKEENGGTNSYAGKAVDYIGGAGPISVDYYEAYDNELETTNRGWLNGIDLGLSVGMPFSLGRVSTNAIPLTNRFDITP